MRIVLLKAHPVNQAVARGSPAPNLNEGELRRNPGEPSAAQAESDRYKKPTLKWNGLTIRVENPAGSVRRGRSRGGQTWETRMVYDYGFVARSEGVDGDEVDVYVGPNPDAPMVYVVHQRCYGDWSKYDEDKAMLGFDSCDDACAAYLKHYDDPRFLGPVTAMPVAEFCEKVKATKEKPAMIKAVARELGDFGEGPRVLFLKAHVKQHTRRLPSGKVITVGPYQTKVQKRARSHEGQADLFGGGGSAKAKPRRKAQPEKAAERSTGKKKFYVTMIRDGKKGPAFLAGPFDTHEEAKSHVERARKKAEEVDPWSVFDAFGTSGVTAEKHPPGVLNDQLGIGAEKNVKTGGEVADYSKKTNNTGEPQENSKGGAMKKFDTLDLQSPETYENNPELATLARRVADKHFKPGGDIRRGDFKREVLAGKHPELVRAELEAREQQKQDSAEKASKGKKAATSVALPAGYSMADEGSNLVVSGPFDEDLHSRIKRAGGRWDGASGTNRRVWIVPAAKGASLKRVLQNWTKANRDRVEAEAEKRRAQEAAQAEARNAAPKIEAGQYGPFTIKDSVRDPNKYVVSFRYDPDLVSAVKGAKSARFNRDTKNWLVDKADSEKLMDILNRGQQMAKEKAAQAAEAERQEAERKRKAREEEKADMERRGISQAAYWSDGMGRGLPGVGETVERRDGYHVVTEVSRGRHMGEDAMSFGGTDDRPYQHRVTLRRATDEEVGAVREREAVAQRKVAAQRDLKSVMRDIRESGTAPESANPKGDVVLDTFDLYGGGERVVIGDDKIWYIRNNGMDGDNWGNNNVRTGGAGAIGWHVPRTPELESQIRQAIQEAA